MVIGYDASGVIKSFLFFYFLVIYMARAGETGLSWIDLLSLYVLVLIFTFVSRSVYVPCFFYSSTWPTGSDVSYVAVFDGCSMIDSWSCINICVLLHYYYLVYFLVLRINSSVSISNLSCLLLYDRLSTANFNSFPGYFVQPCVYMCLRLLRTLVHYS